MKFLLIMFICYGIGNFSTSYLLGKMLKNKDIRQYGSGNAGATNALRVFGVKIAALTFAIDALKGVIAVLIGRLVLGDVGSLVAGVSVVTGHNWPVVLKFKGGKGIATTIGTVATINSLVAIFCILFGLILIFKTKYVSLGSVTAMGILPIVSFIMVRPFNLEFFIFSLILAIMAIYQHRSNIKRLLNGTEKKLGQKT